MSIMICADELGLGGVALVIASIVALNNALAEFDVAVSDPPDLS